MKRNEKQIFNPLNEEEQNGVIGGSSAPKKEFDEKPFFENYGIYQI